MSDGFAGRYEHREVGRRTWPAEVKLRVVTESHVPGVTVSEVARPHRLMPSQVTTWRRLHP
jgi:transposase